MSLSAKRIGEHPAATEAPFTRAAQPMILMNEVNWKMTKGSSQRAIQLMEISPLMLRGSSPCLGRKERSGGTKGEEKTSRRGGGGVQDGGEACVGSLPHQAFLTNDVVGLQDVSGFPNYMILRFIDRPSQLSPPTRSRGVG
jgi:hypothetical protein